SPAPKRRQGVGFCYQAPGRTPKSEREAGTISTGPIQTPERCRAAAAARRPWRRAGDERPDQGRHEQDRNRKVEAGAARYRQGLGAVDAAKRTAPGRPERRPCGTGQELGRTCPRTRTSATRLGTSSTRNREAGARGSIGQARQETARTSRAS